MHTGRDQLAIKHNAATGGAVVLHIGAKIERAMKKAKKIEEKQLKADTKEIEADAKNAS